jgi:hypothetical protein
MIPRGKYTLELDHLPSECRMYVSDNKFRSSNGFEAPLFVGKTGDGASECSCKNTGCSTCVSIDDFYPIEFFDLSEPREINGVNQYPIKILHPDKPFNTSSFINHRCRNALSNRRLGLRVSFEPTPENKQNNGNTYYVILHVDGARRYFYYNKTVFTTPNNCDILMADIFAMKQVEVENNFKVDGSKMVKLRVHLVPCIDRINPQLSQIEDMHHRFPVMQETVSELIQRTMVVIDDFFRLKANYNRIKKEIEDINKNDPDRNTNKFKMEMEQYNYFIMKMDLIVQTNEKEMKHDIEKLIDQYKRLF